MIREARNMELTKPDENFTVGEFLYHEQRIRDSLSCKCGGNWEEDCESSWLEGLRRYRVPFKVKSRWRKAWLLFEDLQGSSQRKSVNRELERRVEVFTNFKVCVCLHNWCKYNKEVTGLYKKGGSFLHEHWRVLCYWETFAGYSHYVDDETILSRARNWLGTVKEVGKLLDLDVLAARVYENTQKYMDRYYSSPYVQSDLMTWVNKGSWMKGKSGTGVTTRIKIDDKSRRTRRMKPVDGKFYTDEDIVCELKRPVREEFRVLQKSETAKVRPVVKCSNGVNRKMDYLSQWVEGGLGGAEFSTLFLRASQSEEMDVELFNLVGDSSYWKVPMDQGGFDEHQPKELIFSVLHAIYDWLKEKGETTPQSEMVWSALFKSIEGEVVVTVGAKNSYGRMVCPVVGGGQHL